MATFESSLKPRLIYIFAINDEWHKDCLKIGETTLDEDGGDFVAPNDPLLQQAARNRIDQYTKTAGIAYQLLYTELTIYFSGGKVCSFNDKQVQSSNSVVAIRCFGMPKCVLGKHCQHLK